MDHIFYKKEQVMKTADIEAKFGGLIRVLMVPEIIDRDGNKLEFSDGFLKTINIIIEQCLKEKNKLIFIGNGGSAAIASHQAVDFFTNLNIKTITFNDPFLLTCISNDFGYENVFSRPMAIQAGKGDILAAISSSGKSKNILNATQIAKEKGCHIITMSGFNPDNPLRKEGDVNFYVASDSYRFVEATHSIYWDFILELLIDLNKKFNGDWNKLELEQLSQD